MRGGAWSWRAFWHALVGHPLDEVGLVRAEQGPALRPSRTTILLRCRSCKGLLELEAASVEP